jgi:hypothetical protein
MKKYEAVMPHIENCPIERTSPPKSGGKWSKIPNFPSQSKVTTSTNQIDPSKDEMTHMCSMWELSKVGGSLRCSNKLEGEYSKA